MSIYIPLVSISKTSQSSKPCLLPDFEAKKLKPLFDLINLDDPALSAAQKINQAYINLLNSIADAASRFDDATQKEAKKLKRFYFSLDNVVLEIKRFQKKIHVYEQDPSFENQAKLMQAKVYAQNAIDNFEFLSLNSKEKFLTDCIEFLRCLLENLVPIILFGLIGTLICPGLGTLIGMGMGGMFAIILKQTEFANSRKLNCFGIFKDDHALIENQAHTLNKALDNMLDTLADEMIKALSDPVPATSKTSGMGTFLL